MDAFKALLVLVAVVLISKWLYQLSRLWVVWDMRRMARRGEVDHDLAEAYVAAYLHNDHAKMRECVARFVQRTVTKDAIRR